MITLPDEIHSFMTTFSEAGFQIFLVGGAMRNLLMKNRTDDWDFTTNATPDEILRLFPNGFYNNKFGTVGIEQEIESTRTIIEVTTFRTETTYENKRHPNEVHWAKTIEEDLSRRDFRMNAIAYDGQQIVDPYNGQQDIKNKIIQTVGEPQARFSEDALRLMRAVRFATQLDFTIEQTTLESIQACSQYIEHVSWERIRDELLRILGSNKPAYGIKLLKETGLLKYILPELDECFSVSQISPKRHHIYDVGTHLVNALENCVSQDVITRLACLLHDIGKVKTYRKDPQTQIITFYNHEVVGAQQVEVIAKRLRLSNKQTHKLVTLVRYHQFTVTELQSDKAVRRFIRQVTPEYLQDMLDLRTADRIGSGATPTSWRYDLFKKRLDEVQQQPFSVTDLKISGKDVMDALSIQPGPIVGKLLNTLFDEVVEKKIQNEREALIARLKELNA